MPAIESGWMITREELEQWILHEDDRLLVVNKPALVVCHPSKNGPWSSLVGACREYTGCERLHMPSRLDRETSGVVVFAKDREMGSLLQQAIQNRKVHKHYLAILTGVLAEAVTVEQPIGFSGAGPVRIRQWVRSDGAPAITHFRPVATGKQFTLAEVRPETGRMHQIRVHAAWLGHPLVGDKMYGADERLFLEFIETGWSEALADRLLLNRQALHARRLEFDVPFATPLAFDAPLAPDLEEFLTAAGISGRAR